MEMTPEEVKAACESIMPIIRIVRDGVLPLIQIGIPIILIVLGTIDLGKAVIASKEDEIKNAQKMLVKRCIYAAAVFFVVTLVTIVFGFLNKANNPSDKNQAVTGTANWQQCWSLD